MTALILLEYKFAAQIIINMGVSVIISRLLFLGYYSGRDQKQGKVFLNTLKFFITESAGMLF